MGKTLAERELLLAELVPLKDRHTGNRYGGGKLISDGLGNKVQRGVPQSAGHTRVTAIGGWAGGRDRRPSSLSELVQLCYSVARNAIISELRKLDNVDLAVRLPSVSVAKTRRHLAAAAPPAISVIERVQKSGERH